MPTNFLNAPLPDTKTSFFKGSYFKASLPTPKHLSRKNAYSRYIKAAHPITKHFISRRYPPSLLFKRRKTFQNCILSRRALPQRKPVFRISLKQRLPIPTHTPDPEATPTAKKNTTKEPHLQYVPYTRTLRLSQPAEEMLQANHLSITALS